MSVSKMTTYDLVGVKEDVSDIISNISPTKTPFQSMIGNESVHNITHQWQEDSLAAAADNAVVDGATAPTAVMNATSLRSNNTQILSKTAQATGTADVVTKYGRAKELAYQLGLKSAELKRDLEYAMVGRGAVAAVAGNSSSTARKMASAQYMIDNSLTYTAGSGGGLGFTGSTPTAVALTEAAIKSVLQACYIGGAEPDTILVKPADAGVIASFQATGRTVFVDNGQKTLTSAVDFYESPWGKVRVVMDRFISTADALVFEAAMWKQLVLRNWFRQTLAITGDATTVQILGEFSLKHRNFFASGRIANIT